MSDMREHGAPHQTTAELAFDIFHRIIAIFCLIAGLRYWSLLIGIAEGGAWRFDLLPVHWKIAAASLAVLWPVAGIGLWMIVSWGPVVWLVAATTEIIMHGAFPELYGSNWLIIASQATIAVLYAVFRIAIYFAKRVDEQAE
ncbi:DUF6163 family protein [Nitratireductor sp. XY-223]|uniref:DUF6163 family protein n=1 Tax=Nitratireductor sp. XY-223 TaxID=2561926 RepID=UPI0010AAAF85|nr:DUF6163 family protein [Nitratireductor sp. XY-223]